MCVHGMYNTGCVYDQCAVLQIYLWVTGVERKQESYQVITTATITLIDPPDHPAFKTGRDKKPNQVQALTTAVTEMARAMTSSGSSAPMTSATASTLPTGPTTTAGISPRKVANLRSNYFQI